MGEMGELVLRILTSGEDEISMRSHNLPFLFQPIDEASCGYPTNPNRLGNILMSQVKVKQLTLRNFLSKLTG
jgi:hypothetical protein